MIREAFQTVSDQKCGQMDDRPPHTKGGLGAKVGFCGQAPSNPDFAEFLVECGIDSISVVPDSFIAVKLTYESRKH
jgi:phosphoenolpyruvate synthase/pyruvate phosphate dikinase